MNELSPKHPADAVTSLTAGAVTARFSSLRQSAIAYPFEIVTGFLLLLMAVNMFAAISHKGITNDEIVHIPAGYYHLVAGDYQLNNEHPPLIKMWAALPLLLIQPQEAPPTEAEKQGVFNGLTWSYEQRFWQANTAQFGRILFWTRAMMIMLAAGLGVLIFSFTRSLFGPSAQVKSRPCR